MRITNQITGAFQQPRIEIGNTSNHTWTSGLYGIPNPSFSFGPEIGLIDAAENGTLPKLGTAVPTYIIKSTTGGTSINYWRPEGVGYTQFQTVLRTALSNLASNGYTVFPQSFIWVQGERDANDGTTDGYADRLELFTNLYREQLGTPMLPFAISEVIALGAAMNTIRTAQATYVAGDSQAFLIDNYPDRDSVGDNIHIAAAGQIAMGADWLTGTRAFSTRPDGILEHLQITSLRPAFEPPTLTQSNGTEITFPLHISEDATLYWSVLQNGSLTPTLQQLKSGTDAVTFGTTTHLQNSIASTSISGLIANTNYDIYLVAETAGGSTSTIKKITTTTRAVPTTPLNLSVNSVSTSSFIATFDNVAGATSYDIRYQTVPSSTWQTITNFVSGDTISNLQPNTVYNIAVLARNQEITSPWSATTSTTTLPTLFADSFDRPDENISDSPNWARLIGISDSFGVINNQVAVIQQQSNFVAAPNQNSANHFVEATWNTTTNQVILLLAARTTNTNNLIGVRRNNNNFELTQIVSNVVTVLGTTTAALQDKVRIEVVGTEARLLKNDIEVIPWTTIDASLTSTRAGLVSRNAPTLDPWIDDFSHGIIP